MSAQVVQYQKQKIGIADGTDIPYNSFNFSPTITAFSQRMGKWAYGFSIVTPQNDLFTGEQKIENAYRDTAAQPALLRGRGRSAALLYQVEPFLLRRVQDDHDRAERRDEVQRQHLPGLHALRHLLHAAGKDAPTAAGTRTSWAATRTIPSRFHESNVTRTVNQMGLGGTGMFGILVRMNQGFSFGVNASPGSLVWVNRTEEQRVLEINNDSLSTVDRPGHIGTRADIVYSLAKDEKHTETSAPSLSLAVSWRPIDALMLTAQTDYYLGSIYSYTGFTPKTRSPRTARDSSTSSRRKRPTLIEKVRS